MQIRLARNDDGGPEIFKSIQGEGRNIGRERTFVRLAGCNLHCVWCDTAYTWNWVGSNFVHERDAPGRPHKFDPAQEVLKMDVAEVAASVCADMTEGVVVTGGEPLMQSEAIVSLIDVVRQTDPRRLFEMETNGSILPSEAMRSRVNLFMVSPKLSHSGNDPAIALRHDALRAFADLPSAVFKFVVRNSEDLDAVAVIAERFGISVDRIYVMPEGTTSAAIIARGRSLIDRTIAHGFNYTDRLHIHLFGDTRGT